MRISAKPSPASDPDRAFEGPFARGQVAEARAEPEGEILGHLGEAPSGLGQTRAVVPPFEERRARLTLEPGQAARHRRGGGVDAPARGEQVPAACDLQEQSQIVPLDRGLGSFCFHATLVCIDAPSTQHGSRLLPP